MTIINNNTVVVYTSLELKEVLENDNNYTYVYFGNNIILSSGISISSSKTNVVIDGTYNDVTYEYTDQKKAGTSDTINIISPLTQKVTVKNMKITGYNYYGIIYVPENSKYIDTVVEYNNVTYVGPQISFHPVGLTRFIDCIITIQDNYATGNEVAECNKIEIGGTTNIIHKSTSNSSFWFRNANPSLTILKDATVNFNSVSRELFYGVNNLNLIISKNASFYVTAHSGLAYGTNGTGTTLIDENAFFSIKQTDYNDSYATWYSYGVITLNKNASLSIISNYLNITKSNYNISFQGSSAGLILNNPEKVILYNSVASVISATNTSSFQFIYNRINLFDNAISIDSDISKDNLPTYSWYKKTELSSVNGTFTNSKTVINNHNYTEEELTNLPSLDNFNFTNKKILSIGTFNFNVAALTDKDVIMKGITEPNASILIEYDAISTVIKADDVGEFSYEYSQSLPVGTVIKFIAKTYNDLLYYTMDIEIVYSGELTLNSATKYFSFKVYPIKDNPILCPRLTEVNIIVTDSRINSSDWKLYATINHDLESSDGKILKDSLVYVDDLGNINVLSSIPTLIYNGTSNNGQIKTTDVHWSEQTGILLQIKDYLENNVEYEAEITWILEE